MTGVQNDSQELRYWEGIHRGGNRGGSQVPFELVFPEVFPSYYTPCWPPQTGSCASAAGLGSDRFEGAVTQDKNRDLVKHDSFLTRLGLCRLHPLPDQVLSSGEPSFNSNEFSNQHYDRRICVPVKSNQSFNFETNSKVRCYQIPRLFDSRPFFYSAKSDPNHLHQYSSVFLERMGAH